MLEGGEDEEGVGRVECGQDGVELAFDREWCGVEAELKERRGRGAIRVADADDGWWIDAGARDAGSVHGGGGRGGRECSVVKCLCRVVHGGPEPRRTVAERSAQSLLAL